MTKPKSQTTKKDTTKKIPDNVDPKTGEILDAPVTNPETAEQTAVAILKTNEQEPEIVPARIEDDGSGRESALSIVGGVSTEQLKQALVVQTEQRKLIQQFIQDNLVVDVDYGKIHVIKDCPDFKRGECKRDYHYSKSILFKPGQEKIFSLFGITDELERDDKVYEMIGNVPGMVAFKCIMYRGKNKVGEGRGAATLGGTQNDPNSTIKKAEKRARMDACLSLGFSAYFTQDLDDPEYKSQREMMNERAKAEAEARDRDENGFLPRDPGEPIDNMERQMLHRLITQAGFEDREEILEFLKANGITVPEAMTSGQARKMITKMKASEFLGPIKREPSKPQDKVIEDIDDGPINLDDIPDMSQEEEPLVIPPKPPEPVAEAQLVIDDEFKTNVQELYNSIGLNGTGWMWWIKHVAGKPFGKWEKLTDEEWRRAYDFTTQILEGRVPVEDRYMGEQPPQQGELGAVANIFPGAKVIKEGEEQS